MTLDFTKGQTPREFDDAPIPKGVVAPMQARVKRGNCGDGGWLTPAATEKGKSAYLHLEITVTDGPYKGRKLWPRPTVEGDGEGHAEAAERSLNLLTSVLRSGHNLSSKDDSDDARAKLRASN
jgi:hypothetical protein